MQLLSKTLSKIIFIDIDQIILKSVEKGKRTRRVKTILQGINLPDFKTFTQLTEYQGLPVALVKGGTHGSMD